MLRSKAWTASLAVSALVLLVGCPINRPAETRIDSFTSSAASIRRGGEVTLSWRATNPATHPEQPSCSISRRLDGRPASEPEEVPCVGTLTEAPDAPEDAGFVRYQLNVLKRPVTTVNPYLTSSITVSFEAEPVTPRVIAVTIDQADATLFVGETLALTANVEAEGTADRSLVWTSSQPAVASVDPDGLLHAHAAGSATITATSAFDPSKHDSIAVTLVSPPGAVRWTRQLGTAQSDGASSVALDAGGNALFVGATSGDLGGPNLGSFDAFVVKLGPSGQTLWIRQFGTADSDGAYAVATDGAGSVFVAGSTHGDLAATNLGEADAFVARFTANGNEVWVRQFGTPTRDEVRGLATDAFGNLVVAGTTSGDLAGTNAGGSDAFVRKYDPDGNPLWTHQFGTSDGDWVSDVDVDAVGNVLVVGGTYGDLAASNAGVSDVFVRKYDPNGNVLWTLQFGSDSSDDVGQVSVGSATFAVAGWTYGDLEGVSTGSPDAFVRTYDLDGNVRWTRQFGTTLIDLALAVAVDGDGHVIVGGKTIGTLGELHHGSWDGFVRKFDALGEVAWTRQLGTFEDDGVNGIAVRPTGEIVVVGDTDGVLDVAHGFGDAFVREYGP